MGAGNVMRISINWAHLPGNAFKIIVRIGLITLDSDPNPRWWGSNAPLLQAIGRTDPDDGDTSAQAAAMRHANGVALRAGIGDAVRAGALSYAVRPSRTRRAEYWLHLELQGNPAVRAGKPCSSPPELQGNPAVRAGKPCSSPPELQGNPAVRAGKPCSSRRKTAGQQAKTAPHEDIGGLETRNREGKISPEVSTSPVPVDSRAAEDHDPSDVVPCPGCGWAAWEIRAQGHGPGCQAAS
jgi:hypothetical protein